MGRAHNDDKGWKRGLGAYSAADSGLMSHKSDDGGKPIKDISGNYDICVGEYAGYKGKEWKPGPLPGGGNSPNRYPPNSPSSTKQVSAASPTGRYGKKGGTGQRSGA